MKIFFMIAFVALIIVMTGCAFLADHREDIATIIMEYAATKGTDAAEEYIDSLVLSGKLDFTVAEKIKKAIPDGIDKLNEILKDGGADE